jgi:hypothetical protein
LARRNPTRECHGAQAVQPAGASSAFVSLLPNKVVSGFYERYGFAVRQPESPGMSLVICGAPEG